MVPSRYADAVEEARDLRRRLWPEARPTHCCLHDAVCLQVVLKREGLTTMLQAGGCSWPFKSPEDDDGVSPTHFSYVWDPEEATKYVLRGTFPEVHVWLAFRSEESPDGVIVDPTTGTWPDRAKAAGLLWTAEPPPDCLWASPEDLYGLEDIRGMSIGYKPSLDACRVADSFAAHGIYPRVVPEVLGAR